MYGWAVMIILLPVWIATEGYNRLSTYLAKNGWSKDMPYIIFLIFAVLAILALLRHLL